MTDVKRVKRSPKSVGAEKMESTLDGTRITSISIKESQYQLLRKLAFDNNMSISSLVMDAINHKY